MSEQVESVESIVARHGFHEHELIAILQEIQRTRNWLPAEDLNSVIRLLGVPKSRVYAIATFYKAFSLEPRGKHVVQVCLGTACHVRGGVRVKEQVERDLDIHAGQTTKDKMFTLEAVNCLGACALGPVVVVDGEYHGQMNTRKATATLNAYAAGAEVQK
jgi:NADH:ubiquinone oxidoreductase subunit E